MVLGKVIGSVWGAKQAAGLEGLKLLQVRPIQLRPGSRHEGGGTRLTPEDCDL